MSQAFFDAVRSGDVVGLLSLIAESPSVIDSVLPGGATGLHVAVEKGDAAMVEALLDLGADIEARNEDGRTPLHDAIEYGHCEIERILFERGATGDINIAAILGNIDQVREFLDRDPGLANDRSTKLSPLGWASFGNQAEVARELLARGARMDDGELLCAASVGHVQVGEVLLAHGADPNQIDERAGGTALHTAICMRYASDTSKFVKMLLASGADPEIRARDGKTALEMAEENARSQAARKAAGEWADFERNFEGVAELLRKRKD